MNPEGVCREWYTKARAFAVTVAPCGRVDTDTIWVVSRGIDAHPQSVRIVKTRTNDRSFIDMLLSETILGARSRAALPLNEMCRVSKDLPESRVLRKSF
jgi:hypothetical protein